MAAILPVTRSSSFIARITRNSNFMDEFQDIAPVVPELQETAASWCKSEKEVATLPESHLYHLIEYVLHYKMLEIALMDDDPMRDTYQ